MPDHYSNRGICKFCDRPIKQFVTGKFKARWVHTHNELRFCLRDGQVVLSEFATPKEAE